MWIGCGGGVGRSSCRTIWYSRWIHESRWTLQSSFHNFKRTCDDGSNCTSNSASHKMNDGIAFTLRHLHKRLVTTRTWAALRWTPLCFCLATKPLIWKTSTAQMLLFRKIFKICCCYCSLSSYLQNQNKNTVKFLFLFHSHANVQTSNFYMNFWTSLIIESIY